MILQQHNINDVICYHIHHVSSAGIPFRDPINHITRFFVTWPYKVSIVLLKPRLQKGRAAVVAGLKQTANLSWIWQNLKARKNVEPYPDGLSHDEEIGWDVWRAVLHLQNAMPGGEADLQTRQEELLSIEGYPGWGFRRMTAIQILVDCHGPFFWQLRNCLQIDHQLCFLASWSNRCRMNLMISSWDTAEHFMDLSSHPKFAICQQFKDQK